MTEHASSSHTLLGINGVARQPATTRLRSALRLPIFNDLADPAVVARVAAEAEAAGWDGVFVWDKLAAGRPIRRLLSGRRRTP